MKYGQVKKIQSTEYGSIKRDQQPLILTGKYIGSDTWIIRYETDYLEGYYMRTSISVSLKAKSLYDVRKWNLMIMSIKHYYNNVCGSL